MPPKRDLHIDSMGDYWVVEVQEKGDEGSLRTILRVGFSHPPSDAELEEVLATAKENITPPPPLQESPNGAGTDGAAGGQEINPAT